MNSTIDINPGKYTVQEIKAYTRLIKLQQGKDYYDRTLDSFERVVLSPFWSLLAGFFIIEYLKKKDIAGEFTGSLAEVGLFGSQMIRSMGETGLLKDLMQTGAQAGGEAASIVTKILPLLALAAPK